MQQKTIPVENYDQFHTQNFKGGTSKKNTLQLTKQIPPLAHEVVYDWVDRTVALENGEMREGLMSCKTSKNYFWRKN